MSRASWNLRKPFWMVILNWISELLASPKSNTNKPLNNESDEQSFRINSTYLHELWDFDEYYDDPMFI